ncbi:cytochrome P450 [Streptomyces sp. 1222.5]|uniref:cytochrome P450 n=1 Tax=Streptomyces sp. 1222.5 TaxID=1881026 RepID=UPI003EBA3DF5
MSPGAGPRTCSSWSPATQLRLLGTRLAPRRQWVPDPGHSRLGEGDAIDDLFGAHSEFELAARTTRSLAHFVPRPSAGPSAYVGAANRDPLRFSEPNALDITRTNNRHLALGHGPHFCIGASMVRVQMRILLRELVTSFPDFHIATGSDLDWNTNLGFRGFRSLPLMFE